MDEAAQQAWQASLRADFWQAVVGNITELAIQFAFLAVLATGAAQVATHGISVGTLVAFLMYILFLMQPINQLTSAFTQYQVGAAAVTRIEEAQQLPAEPPAPAHPTSPGTGPLSVEFDDVRFSYRPELPGAHQGVSFTDPARRHDRVRGPVRRGQDHGVLADRAVLRAGRRPRPGRRRRTSATGRWPRSARPSATSNRTRPSCPAPCARTCCSAPPAPPPPTSTKSSAWPACAT